uniref:CMGC/CDK/CDC2 protein kinase n=1 Tax=Loa loa TaxID=7209 RepID=A0A1I7VWH2_LOALO
MWQHNDAKERNNLRSYRQFEKIGEGAYGVVYKAIHKQTQKPVAIKMIRLEHREEGIPATTLREIALLRELIHPNIICLQGVIMEECRIYLVFEYIDMDLRRYIDLLPDNELMNKTEQKTFLYQILQGICFCHQRRVMHRDLKPQNLLVDANGILKLADFGLARTIGIPLRAYTHEQVVTLWYRAPEILLGAECYTLGVDVWSIGCIFAEMATKLPLFEGDSEIAQIFSIFSILSTPTEEIWPGVTLLPDYQEEFPQWKHCILDKVLGKYMDSNDLDILKAMITYDPARRISAKQLLMNPYFEDIDWEKMKKLFD